MYGIEGKQNEAVVAPLQHAGIEKSMHVAMHGLHVALDPARRLADRHRTGAGHGADEFPTLGCHQGEKQLGRRKADTCPLLFAAKRRFGATRNLLCRGQRKCHRLHLVLHACTSAQKSASNASGVTKA